MLLSRSILHFPALWNLDFDSPCGAGEEQIPNPSLGVLGQKSQCCPSPLPFRGLPRCPGSFSVLTLYERCCAILSFITVFSLKSNKNLFLLLFPLSKDVPSVLEAFPNPMLFFFPSKNVKFFPSNVRFSALLGYNF